jgi:hypothetical protein
MPQLMGVYREAEGSDLARVGNQLPHARVGERALPLREKDVRRVGGGTVLQPAQGANLGGGERMRAGQAPLAPADMDKPLIEVELIPAQGDELRHP